MATNPDQLKNEILKRMKDFNFNVQYDMTEASKKRTREGVKMLKKSHATKDNGNYNKSWRVKKTRYGNVIYNKDFGWLTHLLENGHEIVNNKGENKGYFDGTPHISLVEAQVVANFEADVARIIAEHGGSG